jgi:signal transduction histidine kinase
VEVRLRYEGDMATLMVGDDGIGFDLEIPSPGLGLRSMRERTQLLGGDIVVESAPGKGTRIVVACPVGTSAGAPALATDR